MASKSPALLSSSSSSTNLHQWLTNFTTTFSNHLSNNTTLPVCIFQLPQTLTSEKPDSYLPNHIGLGPIHHFRPDLYANQEQLKIITAKTILQSYTITSNFDKVVLQRLVGLVPVARCCYDLYFDIDDETLSWIFAVDGLFLVDVLTKASYGSLSDALEDVVMVENQIPFVILVELLNSLDHQHVVNGDSDNNSLSNLLVKFCEARVPLKFATPITELDLDINNSFHLLDCVYRLIVNHNLPPENAFLRTNYYMIDVDLDHIEKAVEFAGGLCPGLSLCLKPILIILKLPWMKIAKLIKEKFGAKKPKIDIPSASKLAGLGKIEFCTNHEGIHDIVFDEEKLTFSLPVLDLKSDSEALLRNLVAYEKIMFEKHNITNLVLTEYVDLMCGIIEGVKDVKILQEKNIIEGSLKVEEIVKLFNGISKSSTKGKKSKLRKTIEKVNDHYGNIPSVKVIRFIKKLFLASWKLIALVLSILGLMLMVLYGVCQVYDCKRHFGIRNAQRVFADVTGYNESVDF